MPIYAKKIQTTDKRFAGRKMELYTHGKDHTGYSMIPVSDTIVLCNGCNKNMYPNPCYLVYLSKRDLEADRPYDVYDEVCLKRNFKDFKEVE